MTADQYIAAIDLGSNSFHMVIAQEAEQGSIRIIDRVREMVRLGAGLDENNQLNEEAQLRGLDCLQRFNQRLVSIADHRIRAVGTNTLRAAKNGYEFLQRAQDVLGHRISVISGHEEARLVYLGAAFGLAVRNKNRLVIDIGGGSTELIIGKGYETLQMDSLWMGCVSMTRRIFDDGAITAERMRHARNVVLRELEPVVNRYQSIGWEEVVGTSGTIKAIERLSGDLGIRQDWISIKGLDEISRWLVERGCSDKLEFVSEQRMPVFIGGFMILDTIFRELGIKRMDISEGALREGVAYDLIGRLHNEDSRYQGVQSLVNQFQPDIKQSKRVEVLCLNFLGDVKKIWELNDEIDKKLLVWASALHEIGQTIAYNQNQSHGAYIIENSNMDGFSKQVQRTLALMIKNHRQKLRLDEVKWLPAAWTDKIVYLIVILRLAVTFYRSRSDVSLTGIRLRGTKFAVTLLIPGDWAKEHPLTIFDLETEQEYLGQVGFNLELQICD